MVAINFTMFPDKVENGEKNQTIRESAKVSIGTKLQLYTGMRTKACRKLKDAVCKSVTRVILAERFAIAHGNTVTTGIYLDDFARTDGFVDYVHMWKFFKLRANQNEEFHGWLIKW